jgi:two-component system LytT family response regulator
VRQHVPDVLFLDEQMPGMDGFEVLHALGPHASPVVVFVTAYDQYALDAFESQALDYLLMPFADERFAAVLDRVRARLRERSFASMGERLSGLLASRPPASRSELVARDGGRTLFIPQSDIVWIEAEDYYARVHTRDRRVLVRESLRSLAERLLPPGAFIRVHRGAVLNVNYVAEVEPLASGDQTVVLTTGARLRVSRTHRAALHRAMHGGGHV